MRTVLVPGGPVFVGSPSVAASGANGGYGCALLMTAGPVQALYAWRVEASDYLDGLVDFQVRSGDYIYDATALQVQTVTTF